MTGSIARIGSSTAAAPTAADERAQKLKKAAGDFESLLVKQLLKQAKIGGSEKEGGYADMAVDALASAVEKGGGLGLAKHIEHVIDGHVSTAHGGHASPHSFPPVTAESSKR